MTQTAERPKITFTPFTCPGCKMPITSETMHGWVRQQPQPGDYQIRPIVPCPHCTPGSEARRRARAVARLMGQSHIPSYAAAWSFATMPATISPTAAGLAKRFADGEAAKRGLYLFGNTGGGKTSLAISVIKAVMWREEDAMFIREVDLVERLRAAVARGTEEGDELLWIARNVRWLCLDEMGMSKPTQFVLELLYKLVEGRRSLGLFTIFTSNYNLAALDAYWRPDGSAATDFHPGRRITDRIAEYCDGVHVVGPNQRRKQS